MERPLFRTDLVSRPIEDGGNRFVEVTDPDSGKSFRFYELEYAIACAMDGERDVPGLVEWARIELGLEPSQDELNTVIGTLGDLGYLGDGRAPAVAAPAASAKPAASRSITPPAAPPSEPAPLPRAPTPAPAPPPAMAAKGSDFDLGASGATRRNRAAPPIQGDDIELGFAGSSGPGATAAGAKGSASAGDLELGAAGNTGMGDPDAIEPELGGGSTDIGALSVDQRVDRRVDVPSEDFSDSDVSVDLSDHIPVLAADVKEAVRQSKVMQAVTIPDDQGDSDEVSDRAQTEVTPPPEAARDERPAESPPARAATPPPLAPPAPAPAPIPAEAAIAGSEPVVLPEKPAVVAPRQPEPVAATAIPEKRTGFLLPFLIVLLVLAIAGGGVYWWFFLREKPAADTGTAPAQPTEPTESAAPTEPPATTKITAVLEAGASEEPELAAPRTGVVVWVAEAGSDVVEGDPIVKLKGYERWERELNEATESHRNYEEKLAQATAKGDKKAMQGAEANVQRKQSDIDKAKGELAKFVVAAPIGGVVEVLVEQNDRVTAEQAVAKVLAQTGPVVTFTVPEDRSYSTGDEAAVTSATDDTLKAKCTVSEVEGVLVSVVCPTDSGLAAGTEVILD